MVFRLVHWPNRKSKLGLQQSSKTPRVLSNPFATQPPVMKFIPATRNELKQLLQARKALDAVDDPDFREGFAIDVDRALPAYAGVIVHVFTLLDGSRKAVKECDQLVDNAQKSLAEAHVMADRCKVLAKETIDLRADNEAKTADLRELRKTIDPDEIALKIMYAVDKATETKDGEIKAARAEIAELKSRVEELERSKRKLREAIARLSEKA